MTQDELSWPYDQARLQNIHDAIILPTLLDFYLRTAQIFVYDLL